MIIKKSAEVEKKPVTVEGAKKVSIRWLIGPGSGAADFYMRLFEIEPGGHTPYHSHANEHEVFVLEGRGRVRTETGHVEITTGTFALVQGGEMHCFENPGEGALKFLCLIPRDDK